MKNKNTYKKILLLTSVITAILITSEMNDVNAASPLILNEPVFYSQNYISNPILIAGSTTQITWTGGDPSWNVNLSLTDVEAWTVATSIARDIPNNGSFTYTIPTELRFDGSCGRTYLFYIENVQRTEWYHSPTFTIVCDITSVIDGIGFGINADERYSWIRSVQSGIGENDLILNPVGGNVGIGTITPETNLDIYDANAGFASVMVHNNEGEKWQLGAGGSLFGIFNKDDGEYRLAITNDGNVGIGTTDPNYKLEILTNDAHIGLKTLNHYSQSVISFLDVHGLAGAINYDHNTDKLHLITGGSSAPNDAELTIDENGDVGIGTNTPGAKLDVNGDIKLSGNILSDGNICIGKCS